ncbi:MAG TPA: Hsp20/alpha crystallin family protein [Kofleriaceae bacterium]|jgi:HSP20 family molecular chaperone IbpA|nr:Hsp20/alpha crystallin family protein [Kofleriaceae bacterium]
MTISERLERLRDHLPWRRERHVHIDHQHHAIGPPEGRTVRTPRVSIYESETELLVCADVPGTTIDGTEVHIDQHLLEISARTAPPAGKRALMHELGEGAWYRRFLLPERVIGEDCDATLDNGVLTIRLRKQGHVGGRQIRINQ